MNWKEYKEYWKEEFLFWKRHPEFPILIIINLTIYIYILIK